MSNKYISQKKVNPSGPEGAEVLIIGEAPGYEEDRDGIPFVGTAGQDLDRFLGRIGIPRNKVRVTNVCNHRPADNNFNFLRDSNQLKEGINEVKAYIAKYRSRIKLCIILGKEPLHYIVGFPPKASISKWRGSFIQQDGTTYGITYHPSFLNYNAAAFPVIANDFARFRNVLDNGYRKPVHDFVINPKGFELEAALKEIENAPKVAVDIETSKKNPKKILCFSVAVSSTRAFVFYNSIYEGLSLEFQNICNRVFSSSSTYIWHNGYSFDKEIFYLNGVTVPVHRDTFIQAHALEPEMKRTLAFLGSMYTWEPYWKGMYSDAEDEEDSKGVNEDKFDKNILMEYNCIDSIVTYQVDEEQQKDFKSEPLCKEVSDFEHSRLIPLFTHVNRAGMLVDEERQEILRKAVTRDRDENQATLNAIAGKVINVNSKIALPNLLYNEWKLPPKKKPSSKKDGTKSITANEDAIVSLISYAKGEAERYKTPEMRFHWEKIWAALKLILLLRGQEKLLSNYINFKYHPDKRVRSTYGIGPETGRANCKKYVDKTGLNSQTFPRESYSV